MLDSGQFLFDKQILQPEKLPMFDVLLPPPLYPSLATSPAADAVAGLKQLQDKASRWTSRFFRSFCPTYMVTSLSCMHEQVAYPTGHHIHLPKQEMVLKSRRPLVSYNLLSNND